MDPHVETTRAALLCAMLLLDDENARDSPIGLAAWEFLSQLREQLYKPEDVLGAYEALGLVLRLRLDEG